MAGFNKQEEINPYKTALSILLRRFLWDIQPESWRSRKILKKSKNKFLKQKAVILCNGPSLLRSNLDLLDNVYTFGLNKINLLFDKYHFRPSCIVAVNPFVIEQNAFFYNETEIPLFLDSSGFKQIKRRANIAFIHSLSAIPKFAQDCSLSIYKGYTVTYVALQLAFHMGFYEVALIGCDHNFSTKGTPNKTVSAGKIDDNHFDPNYFTNGQKWQLPDLDQSELSYLMAKNVYNENNRKIYNSTVGGCLEIFPRCTLEDFLQLSNKVDKL